MLHGQWYPEHDFDIASVSKLLRLWGVTEGCNGLPDSSSLIRRLQIRDLLWDSEYELHRMENSCCKCTYIDVHCVTLQVAFVASGRAAPRG